MGIIYRHISPSGKSYIGQTKHDSWEKRAGTDLFVSYGSSPKFYNAIVKYGWENFEHEILESNISSKEELLERENFWISYYSSVEDGYNILSKDVSPLYNDRICDVTTEDLVSDYESGLSLAEIGAKYGVHFTIIYSRLRNTNVKMRSRGANPSTYKRMIRNKICPVCDVEFIAKKTKIVYCSKLCVSVALRYINRGYSVKEGRKLIDLEEIDNTKKEEEYVFPDSYSSVKRGGTISSHRRWHVEAGKVNPKCICCQQDATK